MLLIIGGVQMNKTQYQLIVEQQRKFSESLKKNKEFWQDIYSMVKEYMKQFNELFNVS